MWPFTHDRSTADGRKTFFNSSAGRRTFTRFFRQQTGISFVTWRQQASVFACLPRLAEGMPITEIALELGYESAAAFTTMFRRMLGTTPRSYIAGGRTFGAR